MSFLEIILACIWVYITLQAQDLFSRSLYWAKPPWPANAKQLQSKLLQNMLLFATDRFMLLSLVCDNIMERMTTETDLSVYVSFHTVPVVLSLLMLMLLVQGGMWWDVYKRRRKKKEYLCTTRWNTEEIRGLIYFHMHFHIRDQVFEFDGHCCLF